MKRTFLIILLGSLLLFTACKNQTIAVTKTVQKTTDTVPSAQITTQKPEWTTAPHPTPTPTPEPTEEEIIPTFKQITTILPFLPIDGLKNPIPVDEVFTKAEQTELLKFTMDAELLMTDIFNTMLEDSRKYSMYEEEPIQLNGEYPEADYYYCKGTYDEFKDLTKATAHYYTQEAIKDYLKQTYYYVYNEKLVEIAAAGGGWYTYETTPQVIYAFSKTSAVVDFYAVDDIEGYREIYFQINKTDGEWIITGIDCMAFLDEEYNREFICGQ